MKNLIVTTLVLVFLTGCGVHLYNSTPQFTTYAPDQKTHKGNVVFSSFDVPQEDGELLLRFMFGTPQNISSSLYDVTDSLEFLGTLANGSSQFIAYNPPLGKRIFMLTFPDFPKPLTLDHTDFIEVDVTSNRTIHLSVAAYGFRKMTYFTEIAMEDKDFAYCSSLTGKFGEREDTIRHYMDEHQIDPNAKYFLKYCRGFSDTLKRITTPNEKGYEEFEKYRVAVEKLKEVNMPEWKKTYVPKAPFNLLKNYETPQTEENKNQ